MQDLISGDDHASSYAASIGKAKNNSSEVKPSNKSRERAEIAQYVAHMSAELAEMASSAQLDTVSYLLSMAKLEADVEARRA